MKYIRYLEIIKIGSHSFISIKCAYNTALIAESEEKLQLLDDRVVDATERKGLELNESKTNKIARSNILIKGERLKQVERFKYLGSYIT